MFKIFNHKKYRIGKNLAWKHLVFLKKICIHGPLEAEQEPNTALWPLKDYCNFRKP